MVGFYGALYTINTVSNTLYGTLYIYTVYGTWYTVHGTRYTVYGIRYTVYGIRYTVHGTRYMVYGTWYSVHAIATGPCGRAMPPGPDPRAQPIKSIEH